MLAFIPTRLVRPNFPKLNNQLELNNNKIIKTHKKDEN